jgi:hypothetical protein
VIVRDPAQEPRSYGRPTKTTRLFSSSRVVLFGAYRIIWRTPTSTASTAATTPSIANP